MNSTKRRLLPFGFTFIKTVFYMFWPNKIQNIL